jgi:3-hydroxyisobutyrate dehydrogenase
MTPIGFVGVGTMGSALAGRLVGAHSLLVHDVRPESAADLVAAGARFAALEEIGELCATVLLCLPAPAHVLDVLFGRGGLARALRPGSVVVDITSSTPLVDRDVADRLATLGVGFVDAPVAGGVRRAREGLATLMVGGDAAVLDKVRPILEDITPNVFHVGAVGTGHAMKLVNNLLNTCHRFATLQVLHLAESSGIDERTAIAVLNSGSGRSNVTEYTYPVLLHQGQQHGFTLELMRKDVDLAVELGRSLGLDLEIAELVDRYMHDAVDRLGPSADQTDLMLRWLDVS